MHGMTTGLAREFAKDGITVNTVAPCAVVTPQYREIEKSNPDLIAKVVGVIPMGRAGTEEEVRSEEHTSELQSLMRISYAVFCLKKNKHLTTLLLTPNTKNQSRTKTTYTQ